MDSPSENRGLPVTHIAAILVALVVLGLLGLKVTSDRQEQGAAEAAIVQPGALPLGELNTAAEFKGTLALLNDYSVGETGLDQLVADRIYGPRVLNASQYEGPVQFTLASNFVMQLNAWSTPMEVQSFGHIARTIAMHGEQGTNGQQVVEQFARMPGGRLILQARRDPQLMMEFNRLTRLRTEQLQSYKIIADMTRAFHQEWQLPPAPDGPVAMPESPVELGVDVFKQTLAHRLRQWELNGIRYFLCLGGSPKFSAQVQSMFPADTRPLYGHAINATVDPIKRRFRTVMALSPVSRDSVGPDGTAGSVLVPSTNGIISLVEFTGALPRAKLYADWIVETNDARAHEILFSPGFDPQNTVVMQAEIAQPEQPARTVDLPDLEVAERDDITIKIPPTKFATVLLLNEPFEEGRSVQVDGQSTPLLRANTAVSALPLSPSESERTITIGSASGFGGLGIKPLIAIVVIAVIVLLARRRA